MIVILFESRHSSGIALVADLTNRFYSTGFEFMSRLFIALLVAVAGFATPVSAAMTEWQDIGGGMAAHGILPVHHRIDTRIARLVTNGGGVKQNLGAH